MTPRRCPLGSCSLTSGPKFVASSKLDDAPWGDFPAATVTLHNINTNADTIRQTDEVGRYFFASVIPGTYEIKIEIDGFRSYLQQNLLVQTRADITVNASLEIGAITEIVTVEESPVALKFNSTTMETTIDTKMANELPIIHRNPFLLAQLDPAVKYIGGNETSPYHHWAASQMDVGGDTVASTSAEGMVSHVRWSPDGSDSAG